MANRGSVSFNGRWSDVDVPYSALVQAVITLVLILFFFIDSKTLIVPIALVSIVFTGSS